MSQSCAISTCKHVSRTLCYGCNQNFCSDHMVEHDSSINSQLNPLYDEINALGERLNSVNLEKMISSSYEKLEQWRKSSHKTIDEFFEDKRREFDRYISKKLEKQRQEIDGMRTKMSKLLREQEATHKDIDSFTSNIRTVEHEINRIERTSYQISIKSLPIDDSIIEIDTSEIERFDVSSLSQIYKTINYPRENWGPLACSNRYILIHQEPNLCLVDRELNILQQNSWIYGTIYDMCWSAALNRFIVINGSDVFLVSQDNMSIENIQIMQKHKWLSCTTSETSLYLSTKVWGSSVMEFSLLPTIQFLKQWQSPDTCARDEVINGIIYNNGTIAIMIKNPSQQTLRMELRSAGALKRLWSAELNITYSQSIRTRCSLLSHDEWLVVDRNTLKIFHILKDGKIKGTCAYNPPPFCAAILNHNMLAISTARGVNLHKL